MTDSNQFDYDSPEQSLLELELSIQREQEMFDVPDNDFWNRLSTHLPKEKNLKLAITKRIKNNLISRQVVNLAKVCKRGAVAVPELIKPNQKKLRNLFWGLVAIDAVFFCYTGFKYDLIQNALNSPETSVKRGIRHYQKHSTELDPEDEFDDDEIRAMAKAEEVGRFLRSEYGIQETWDYSEYYAGDSGIINVIIPEDFDIELLQDQLTNKFKIKLFVQKVEDSKYAQANEHRIVVNPSEYHTIYRLPSYIPTEKGSIGLSE